MSTQTPYSAPKEGAIMGPAIGITLYGLVIVFASLFADEDLVPSTPARAVIALIVIGVVCAVLGAIYDRVRG